MMLVGFFSDILILVILGWENKFAVAVSFPNSNERERESERDTTSSNQC